MIKRMERELSHGNQEIYTTVITLMMNEWVTEKCIGLMDLFIKVNGKRVFKTAVELCLFQMEELKMSILKTMYLKEIHKS